MPENQLPQAPKRLMTFIGVGITSVAVLLSIAVVPMLLFARDSRDLTGGVAGAVLILIMVLAGVVLIFREKTPAPLMRVFYLTLGGLSLLAGIATIGLAFYKQSQGQSVEMRKGFLAVPLAMIGVGGYWIYRAFNLPTADPAKTAGSSDH